MRKLRENKKSKRLNKLGGCRQIWSVAHSAGSYWSAELNETHDKVGMAAALRTQSNATQNKAPHHSNSFGEWNKEENICNA